MITRVEEGEMWTYCLMGTECLCGVMKKFWKWLVVTVIQHCECS